MLICQKSEFDIPTDVTFLNCANLAPLKKDVVQIGHESISKKLRPYEIKMEDWFEPTARLKQNFASLINAPHFNRIAIIPSVSYGVASVANNIEIGPGEEILVLQEQYPSNYFSWQKLAKHNGARLKIVAPSEGEKRCGKIWNEKILSAITDKTKVVSLCNVHWTDGTLFDLREIGKKAREYGAYFVIDGSQSIGALPFDIVEIKPDALLCVGYKWLLGPFGIGLAYFGERFDNGQPLEENWINREGSENFQNLANYSPTYKPAAHRYNVGENSSMHLAPMLNRSIEALQHWGVKNIQEYCKAISAGSIQDIRDLGCHIDESGYRSGHLFGIRFPNGFNFEKLQKKLVQNKIYASMRGDALRVSVNVYNSVSDLERLTENIKETL